nr:uncharacterized protein LOC109181525 [Ipomoea batatas]
MSGVFLKRKWFAWHVCYRSSLFQLSTFCPFSSISSWQRFTDYLGRSIKNLQGFLRLVRIKYKPSATKPHNSVSEGPSPVDQDPHRQILAGGDDGKRE